MLQVGKVYTHYKKGDRYTVLDFAKHSETQEDMIIYQAEYGNRAIWVRPLNMWNDEIAENKVTDFGQSVRFKEES